MITKVPQAMVPTISKIALLFRKRTTLEIKAQPLSFNASAYLGFLC